MGQTIKVLTADRTCVDLIVFGHNAELVEDLMDHGISTSIGRYIGRMNWNLEWAGINFNGFEENLLDCSDRMKAVLYKDEARLRDVVADKDYASNSEHDGYSLYEMTTLVGWRRGCEILWENMIPIEVVECHNTLLYLAINSKQLDVFKFWLDIRPRLDGKALDCVGTLEAAFDTVVSSKPFKDWIDMIISALVQQRTELQRLWESRLCSCGQFDTERVLDARAQRVFKVLRKRKVPVKPCLRPARGSIYFGHHDRLNALEALYEAGFHDLTAEDFSNLQPKMVSPLFFLVTSGQSIYNRDLARVAQWYLGKGATLDEQWPGGCITLSSCLAWKLGNRYMDISLMASEENEIGKFALLCAERGADTCTCHCSSSGCLWVTMACKGLLTPHGYLGDTEEDIAWHWRQLRRQLSGRLEALTYWVEEATNKCPGNRWLVTELIRLVAFVKLRIRHTCCDPKRIEHNGEPKLDVSPHPRHPPDEIERITEEDRELTKLLEKLVVEYDALYATSRAWGLVDFIEEEIIPKLDCELARLREEDIEKFTAGRQQLGIVMEFAGSEEDESESTEGDDISEEEESDDEE
jgi:hypothetical protein